MSNSQSYTSEEFRTERHAAWRARNSEPILSTHAVPQEGISLSSRIAHGADIGRRGNSTLHAASMQRMQQTYGNRAVQRMAVQRTPEDEMLRRRRLRTPVFPTAPPSSHQVPSPEGASEEGHEITPVGARVPLGNGGSISANANQVAVGVESDGVEAELAREHDGNLSASFGTSPQGYRLYGGGSISGNPAEGTLSTSAHIGRGESSDPNNWRVTVGSNPLQGSLSAQMRHGRWSAGANYSPGASDGEHGSEGEGPSTARAGFNLRYGSPHGREISELNERARGATSPAAAAMAMAQGAATPGESGHRGVRPTMPSAQNAADPDTQRAIRSVDGAIAAANNRVPYAVVANPDLERFVNHAIANPNRPRGSRPVPRTGINPHPRIEHAPLPAHPPAGPDVSAELRGGVDPERGYYGELEVSGSW
jgi:hypothetical protein